MNYHPEDRPDPTEQPIRARVPDHVAGGCFSTGVIVMTAQTEFILDFVQNLGRPHQIVARVVLPHGVLPQLVDALHRNIELYRTRWGELPQIATSKPAANSGGSLPEVSQIDTATLPPAEPSTSPPTDSAAPGIPGSTGVSPPPQSSQSGTPAASAGHSEARPSNTERPAPNPPREGKECKIGRAHV